MRRLAYLSFLAALLLLLFRAPDLLAALRVNLAMFPLASALTGEVEALGDAVQETLMDNEPRSVSAAIGLGRLALLRGDWSRAAGHFSLAADLGGYTDQAFIWLGEALWRVGQPQSAQAAWEETAALDYRFAIWLEGHRDWGQGVTGLDVAGFDALLASLYLRSIEAGNRYTYLYVNLGEYYEGIGEVEQAAYWLERGFEEATGGLLWLPASSLGRLYKAAGDYEQARYWFQQAIDRSSFPRPLYVSDIAETYELEGDLQTALEFYRQALAMDPGNNGIRKSIRRVENAIREGGGSP